MFHFLNYFFVKSISDSYLDSYFDCDDRQLTIAAHFFRSKSSHLNFFRKNNDSKHNESLTTPIRN